MKYQILVLTHNKNKEECLNLVHSLNISDDVLICCQNNTSEIINEKNTEIVMSNDIGVSNNRNNLLNNASGDICICIDDDCPLVDNYLEIIESTFKKYPDAQFILFNGIVTHENNRLVHNKKTKRVRRFKDVSYAGGPGLVFKRDAIKKYNLKYDTNVGYPNKIQI